MTTRGPAFRFIDLFAGVGGFHHALASPEFGGECVLASDIDDKCRTVYAATWPDMPSSRIVGDIRALTMVDGVDRPDHEIDAAIADHDVLCAGFPCQPFSKSGAQKGTDDETRGTLFHDILTIARVKRPQFLILENVRNLAGPNHRDTWSTIINKLRELGYRVSSEPVVFSPHLLPPHLEGAPQSRDRVFILASRAEDGGNLSQDPLVVRGPIGSWNPHRWNIEDYLLDDDDIHRLADYQLREEEVAWLDAWQAFIQGIPDDDLPGFPIWVDAFKKRPRIPSGTPAWKVDFLRKNSSFYVKHQEFIDRWLDMSWGADGRYRVQDFPASRRKFEWQARLAQPSRSDRDLWTLTLHLRPSGVRVKPATYLPALVAITQTSIIGSRRRRITPVEAGRLQGLPDDVFQSSGVDDKTAYKQAGNGVNVGVVKLVASQLFESAGVPWGTEHAAAVQAAYNSSPIGLVDHRDVPSDALDDENVA